MKTYDPLLPGFLSSLFSVADCLAPAPLNYDLMVLCKYVYYYYYFLAHQHKACRQLKIKQEMTAVGD